MFLGTQLEDSVSLYKVLQKTKNKTLFLFVLYFCGIMYIVFNFFLYFLQMFQFSK